MVREKMPDVIVLLPAITAACVGDRSWLAFRVYGPPRAQMER